MRFVDCLHQARVMLAEGAVIERLRRNPAVRLDPHIANAGMIYDESGRAVLRRIYAQYLDIGRDHGLPMIIGTPTWRASPERLAAAGHADVSTVNRDAVRFLVEIRASYGGYAERVFIGGLLGCRGDAYGPREALTADAATEFHQAQVDALSRAGVDFLFAATLPVATEALGLARAMAATGTPYILSFVVRPTGALLDGTPLATAIAEIDSTVHPPPLAYMVNCVHPEVFAAALEQQVRISARVAERMLGLQANTSRRPPEELDNATELDVEPPERFAAAMLAVQRRVGTKILGGCCGTDERHIRCLAELLAGAGPMRQ